MKLNSAFVISCGFCKFLAPFVFSHLSNSVW
jgi:hypothetical protein